MVHGISGRLAIAILVVISATRAGAATFQGLVQDEDGRPVAGSRVMAEDAQRGYRRVTTSDDAGLFTIPELAPGRYLVVVDHDGFEPWRLLDLDLAVGQVRRLDVVLVRIEVSESIEAVAAPPSLETIGRSTVDGVISHEQIDRLPLNGRNFLELAFLVPGNVPTPNFDPTKSNTVVVASAGLSGRSSMVTIDGADNNDDVVGGPLENLPQDAVREFQIATNRFTAETGRSGAAAINVVTRSGTDTLRGTASVFARDDSLQAESPIQDASQDAPPFDRQQYSLSLGGPLRTGVAHWFAAVEYRDQSGGILVGERDSASRTIVRRFAAAPLEDLLGTARFDWAPSPRDAFTARLAWEDADDTAASTLDRSIGSASQRQASSNQYASLLATWDRTISTSVFHSLLLSYSRFRNEIAPLAPGVPQLTFPSIQDGSSFRVPQGTDQDRLQLRDSLTVARGNHSLKLGLEVHQVEAAFDLGVFQAGRVELIQDFPQADFNGDGRIDDEDLLFSVTLRSAFPDRDLILDDIHNTYLALYAHDDWWVNPQLTLNLGLRWEMDTNVNNQSGYDDRNPLVEDFYHGDRRRDDDNLGPRLGFNYASRGGRFSLHGGWGLYYDRITLQITSLEQGLDGRALPIEVRAGNVFFLDPQTGRFADGAPTLSNPFGGFILSGAGASGINIIDNDLETPEVQQWNLGTEIDLSHGYFLRADALYNRGTNFIIGRTVGTVFNPVVGGPDRVVNLESSVGMRYRALLLSLERRVGRYRLLASYTLSKSENYSNDDQIPFSNGPIDPNDLEREWGPSPYDRRHRVTVSGSVELPWGFQVAPVLTWSSGVPMDILMPDGSMRVPTLGRNAGGRRFDSGAELNDYLRTLNASGGVDGVLLPLVDDEARFSDDFSSLDLRITKVFHFGEGRSLEAILEVFNVFDTTNILGVSTRNYSGYSNVLARDSDDPADPGYLRSSSFGTPVTTAGGVFGSGGPRAIQLGVRFRL